MDFDAEWCPGCDKQILPKRIPLQLAPPPPPPSSPNTIRRSKTGTVRQRGGLVQGTGRVKPNGTIKRTDSPQLPVKPRTMLDPSPIPLYCCDECQLADIHNSHGALPINYNPDRLSIAPAPVDVPSHHSESDSSSVDSHSSLSPAASYLAATPLSPSIATLAALYNFPPLPPPAPTFAADAAAAVAESVHYPNDYTSGVMMAARRIADLCPKPAPPRRTAYTPAPEPRKPIPGWTDGSNAWRASIYSFSSPRTGADAPGPSSPSKAYSSFAASSHRARAGVHSTLGSPSPSSRLKAAGSTSLPAQSASDLLSRYSQSFNRRSDSRASLASSPTSPSPSVASFPASTRRARERSLLKPGAEGRLLVPDVKMKVHGGSSTSLGSVWAETGAGAARRNVRSPLSASGDEDYKASSETHSTRSESLKRPVVEARSWSYDNLKTYPVMRLPPKKEKRMEKRVVDGVEVEVEVEVIVHEPLKRLFLFPASTRP